MMGTHYGVRPGENSLYVPNITVSITGSTTSTWQPSSGALSLPTAGTYYLVPSGGNVNVSVKMWGAGGGASQGGAGGYAAGQITLNLGQTYTIIVGGAGIHASGEGAGGGGFSGIFLSSTINQGNAILIAGGGGGGMSDPRTGLGGGGGGTNGQNGTGYDGTNFGGFGGTQSSGGAAWNSANGTAGSALQGGTSGNAAAAGGTPGGGGAGSSGGWGGGGGGGGYFGGGGGQSTVSSAKGNGGGGSGYINSGLVSNGNLISASYTTAGNSGDSDRGTSGNTATAGKVLLTLL